MKWCKSNSCSTSLSKFVLLVSIGRALFMCVKKFSARKFSHLTGNKKFETVEYFLSLKSGTPKESAPSKCQLIESFNLFAPRHPETKSKSFALEPHQAQHMLNLNSKVVFYTPIKPLQIGT